MPKPALLRTVLATAALAVLGATQVACQPAVRPPGDRPGGRARAHQPAGVQHRPRRRHRRPHGHPHQHGQLADPGHRADHRRPARRTSSGWRPDRPRASPSDRTARPPVRARFTPTSNGLKFATLTVVNNSATPRYEIRLRGVSAIGTVGHTEPQLAQLMRLFGYQTNVGFTGGVPGDDPRHLRRRGGQPLLRAGRLVAPGAADPDRPLHGGLLRQRPLGTHPEQLGDQAAHVPLPARRVRRRGRR